MNELHPINLATRTPDGTRCLMCLRYCMLRPGQAGFCRSVVNHAGTLYSTIYGLIAEYGVDPIEKKPVRCYRPGTKVLSLGSLGCNLRCAWCQNWEIAFADAKHPPKTLRSSPEQVVDAALRASCSGIAWTYNEPSIWTDFIADCAKAARAAGLYTVLVTNGMFSPESIEILAPLIDVYRADFKSLRPELYHQHAQLASPAALLENTVRMYQAGAHVELVTVLMPTYFDDEHLAEMAEWIGTNLGLDTPWHLTRFVPYAALTQLPPTGGPELAHAHSIATQAGLERVFAGDWYELASDIPGGRDAQAPRP